MISPLCHRNKGSCFILSQLVQLTQYCLQAVAPTPFRVSEGGHSRPYLKMPGIAHGTLCMHTVLSHGPSLPLSSVHTSSFTSHPIEFIPVLPPSPMKLPCLIRGSWWNTCHHSQHFQCVIRNKDVRNKILWSPPNSKVKH